MNDYVKINQLSRPVLRKCSCCNKVQDIYYRCDIRNFGNVELMEGDLDLCKSCGTNLNRILGNELPIGDKVVKSFKLF